MFARYQKQIQRTTEWLVYNLDGQLTIIMAARALVVVMAALVVVLVVVQFHRFCEENIIPSLVALDALLLNDFTELLTNRPLNLGFSLKMRLSPFVGSRSIIDCLSRMIYSYLVAKGDVKGIAFFFNIQRRLSQRKSLRVADTEERFVSKLITPQTHQSDGTMHFLRRQRQS